MTKKHLVSSRSQSSSTDITYDHITLRISPITFCTMRYCHTICVFTIYYHKASVINITIKATLARLIMII